MAEGLFYDFNMNRLENRLATFQDWPFTEETGASCTATKVSAYIEFFTLDLAVLEISNEIKLFVALFLIVIRWQRQASIILPMIAIQTLLAALFVSKNLKDGNLMIIPGTNLFFSVLKIKNLTQKKQQQQKELLTLNIYVTVIPLKVA